MKQRIVTGVVAGAGFIALLILGSYWYAALLLLMAIIGYDEFVRMIHMKANKGTYAAGWLGLIVLTIPWSLTGWSFQPDTSAVIWLLMFVLLAITVLSKNKITIDQIALLFIGVVYIGIGFYYMILTRLENGLFWTLLIFLCIWASDAGAYFVGSKLGKHPLWPVISPKKSVEGSIGGVIIAAIVAVAFALYDPELLSIGRAALLGVVIAVVGQLGDLIQSAYKRVKGINDTGAILPGHGGILDRVDSWLIVFPIVHLLSLLP
ncbi:phosphatidate cytidylyltransferase [Paenibacillus larvae]|uniref:phosphatidate cytidylyltransferase n=1 Tax=Paenibacillus larvae TaxID=1464 RepID=UPI00288EF5A0|nr:phosphatidate cytidylyltransferase [Paenibacillus larvae]MDT2197746.1 phosphatidate cytidylyltransferase [Paenibacillus larvae]